MRTFLVAVAMLGATAGYVVLHPPLDLAVGRGTLSACPTQFGGWNGSDLSFDDAVLEEIKADDVLVRRYQQGGDVAWLCVVVHQNRRYGAHDPRVCYESQGYLVGPMSRRHVEDGTPGGLEVNRFSAERTADRRLVYHWWLTPGLATADVGAFRDRMALRGALDNRSIGAFVRVEMLERGDPTTAEARLDEFTGLVARGLPRIIASPTPLGAAR